MLKLISQESADKYEVIFPLFSKLYNEFGALSKKKPDGVVNKSKVFMINRLLTSARELLTDEPVIEFLDEIEEDQVPQNSDIVLMLSQYDVALRKYRDDRRRWGKWIFTSEHLEANDDDYWKFNT